MNRKHRLKALEKKMKPPVTGIQAFLPDWLQGDDYKEPVASPGERIIVPSGYLALQSDGTVKWHD